MQNEQSINNVVKVLTKWVPQGSEHEVEEFSSGPNKGELTGWMKHIGRDWPRWNFQESLFQKDPYTVPIKHKSSGLVKKSRRVRFMVALRRFRRFFSRP